MDENNQPTSILPKFSAAKLMFSQIWPCFDLFFLIVISWKNLFWWSCVFKKLSGSVRLLGYCVSYINRSTKSIKFSLIVDSPTDFWIQILSISCFKKWDNPFPYGCPAKRSGSCSSVFHKFSASIELVSTVSDVWSAQTLK